MTVLSLHAGPEEWVVDVREYGETEVQAAVTGEVLYRSASEGRRRRLVTGTALDGQ